MATEPNDPNDRALDDLFALAREDAPDANLAARVAADAAAVQVEHVTPPMPSAAPRRGLFAGLAQVLGGWGMVSGVTAAGVAGLAVGLYAPDAIFDVLEGSAAVSLGVGEVSVMPDFSDLALEDGDV